MLLWFEQKTLVTLLLFNVSKGLQNISSDTHCNLNCSASKYQGAMFRGKESEAQKSNIESRPQQF